MVGGSTVSTSERQRKASVARAGSIRRENRLGREAVQSTQAPSMQVPSAMLTSVCPEHTGKSLEGLKQARGHETIKCTFLKRSLWLK